MTEPLTAFAGPSLLRHALLPVAGRWSARLTAGAARARRSAATSTIELTEGTPAASTANSM